MDNLELLKKGLAALIMGVGIVVGIGTFPRAITRTIFLPFLVPICGVKFAIIFLIFQIGYCYLLDIKKGFFWIIGFFIPGAILGTLNALLWGGNVLRALLVMGACVSAVALSFGVFGEKL
ncbi:MAG: hypothetical protein LWW95_11230 [Candidatus Desulfofervidus auxilii]|nr:hypothetical protein [Candidatus Desulfofervidus auxilii]